MLRFMRKHSHSPVLLVIIGVIALVFVFWGVGTNMGGGGGKVATVDGREIPVADYNRTYNNLLESYKQRFGGQVPEGLLNSATIRQQAIGQLVQMSLIQKGAEELGIMISDAEVQRTISSIPAFQKYGHFDLATYKAVLEQNRRSETAFEEGVRADLTRERITDLIAGFADVSEGETDQWMRYAELELKLAYASFKRTAFASQVKADDKALAAWYKDKKEQYRPAPQYKFSYLFFPFSAQMGKAPISEAEARAYFTEQADRWTAPERRHLRHILFQVEPNAPESTHAAKKAAAEQALTKLKSGANFVELANTVTEDPSGKGQGGDLGLVNRGRMVPEFENAAFALKAGEVSEVVKTPFGFHIIKVEEILPEQKPEFSAKRAEIEQILGLKKARALSFQEASQANDAILRTGSVAKYKAAGNKLEQTDFMDQNNVPESQSLFREPAIAKAAFSLSKGELSSILEGTKGYAILFADDVKKLEPPTLDTIRAQVLADFTKEKSTELMRKAAEDAATALNKDSKWPQGVQVQESGFIGRAVQASNLPPMMVQDAFARIGKGKSPEAPVGDGEELFVYQIRETREGKNTQPAGLRANLRAQILQDRRARAFNTWLNAVRLKSKIWVNPEILQTNP